MPDPDLMERVGVFSEETLRATWSQVSDPQVWVDEEIIYGIPIGVKKMKKSMVEELVKTVDQHNERKMVVVWAFIEKLRARVLELEDDAGIGPGGTYAYHYTCPNCCQSNTFTIPKGTTLVDHMKETKAYCVSCECDFVAEAKK